MIFDSVLERPEIRPAPLSDLHHPVQKGDVPAALPPAPFTLSPMMEMLARFQRGHHETILGRDSLDISFCASFCTRNFFSCMLMPVPPSPVSASAPSPMQISLPLLPWVHLSALHIWWCNCSSPRPWSIKHSQVQFGPT